MIIGKIKITLLLLGYAVVMSSCIGLEKLEQKITAKPIAARYTGGHRDYITLALYTDSTFFYVHAPHLMPALQNRRKGWYWIDSTSLILYANRRWHLFWKKPKPEIFRVKGNRVLMYSQAQENSEDGDFIKAYYTLTLEK